MDTVDKSVYNTILCLKPVSLMCISHFKPIPNISHFPKTLCRVDKTGYPHTLVKGLPSLLLRGKKGGTPMECLPLTVIFVCITALFLEDSPDGENRTVSCAGYDYTCSGCGCVHDLSAARINSHMARIADDIAGLRVFQTVHSRAHTSVRRRRVGQIYAEVLIHAHNKSGTVRTVCQTGAAVHIGITHKLLRKLYHVGP